MGSLREDHPILGSSKEGKTLFASFQWPNGFLGVGTGVLWGRVSPWLLWLFPHFSLHRHITKDNAEKGHMLFLVCAGEGGVRLSREPLPARQALY